MGRTFIVDDNEDMRVLLRAVIDQANSGLRVVGEAASGEEALTVSAGLDIDAVVLDQSMPGLTGIETAKALLDREPGLAILLYSAFIEDHLIEEAQRVGIRRCVSRSDIRGLIGALCDVCGEECG